MENKISWVSVHWLLHQKTLQGTVWLFSVFWAKSLEAGAEHTPLGAVTPSLRSEVALVLQTHVTAVCEQESRHAALPAGVWSQHRGSTLRACEAVGRTPDALAQGLSCSGTLKLIS